MSNIIHIIYKINAGSNPTIDNCGWWLFANSFTVKFVFAVRLIANIVSLFSLCTSNLSCLLVGFETLDYKSHAFGIFLGISHARL